MKRGRGHWTVKLQPVRPLVTSLCYANDVSVLQSNGNGLSLDGCRVLRGGGGVGGWRVGGSQCSVRSQWGRLKTGLTV